jgi:hypothetical protein
MVMIELGMTLPYEGCLPRQPIRNGSGGSVCEKEKLQEAKPSGR